MVAAVVRGRLDGAEVLATASLSRARFGFSGIERLEDAERALSECGLGECNVEDDDDAEVGGGVTDVEVDADNVREDGYEGRWGRGARCSGAYCESGRYCSCISPMGWNWLGGGSWW